MAAIAKQVLRVLLAFVAASLAVINLLIAPDQLSQVGFAAGNREPNEVAYVLNFVMAFASVAVVVWIAVTKRIATQALAVSMMFVATLALYLASW